MYIACVFDARSTQTVHSLFDRLKQTPPPPPPPPLPAATTTATCQCLTWATTTFRTYENGSSLVRAFDELLSSEQVFETNAFLSHTHTYVHSIKLFDKTFCGEFCRMMKSLNEFANVMGHVHTFEGNRDKIFQFSSKKWPMATLKQSSGQFDLMF